MSAPLARHDALFAEIKSNHRLRWGLWAIAVIVWLYLVLVLRDQVPRETQAYRAAARQLQETRSAASDTQWTARRAEAMRLSSELESRLWRAGSLGLAQASLNDFLARAAQQAAVQRPVISVAAQEAEPAASGGAAGVWKVTARVSFEFSPSTFYAFLAGLASSESRIVVESINVRSSSAARAELTLVAYFLGAAAAPAAAAAAKGG